MSDPAQRDGFDPKTKYTISCGCGIVCQVRTAIIRTGFSVFTKDMENKEYKENHYFPGITCQYDMSIVMKNGF
jgi:hypothetical protein